MTSTYGSVDDGPDPQQALAWQERLNERPAIRAYKRHSHDLVAGAGRVLDVGCGPGTDAVALGLGRVVGLDPSAVMCASARGRGVTACRGDAHALPFAGGSFDASRADRVVQHLADPLVAVRELVRVTRPGGRVVVADPDQESLVVHVPGAPQHVVDQVKRLRRDVGYRNGRLAGALPEMFAALGLTEVEVAAFPLVLTHPDEAFGLPSWPYVWRDRGIGDWSEDDLHRWDEAIDAGRASGFLYALLYLVVAGTRP